MATIRVKRTTIGNDSTAIIWDQEKRYNGSHIAAKIKGGKLKTDDEYLISLARRNKALIVTDGTEGENGPTAAQVAATEPQGASAPSEEQAATAPPATNEPHDELDDADIDELKRIAENEAVDIGRAATCTGIAKKIREARAAKETN